MTSEERIEKVTKLCIEGANNEKKSRENFLKVLQLETDNIVSAISPHAMPEVSFIVYSLECVLEMMKDTMKRYPKEEINYQILKALINSTSISVEVPKRSQDDK